ncbi:Omp28-related outer membrane protein [Ferruginibacter yonginensis]|uniref:Omp28-related outer membrane protein n=1 Tax=Ferruginibacter yonginensis TaxID=1310416 RepID=A0ABV8QP06_9BACT
MRKLLYLTAVVLLGALFSCTKIESDFSEPVQDYITVKPSAFNVLKDTELSFLVVNAKNENVTSQAKLFVNGTLVNGTTYNFDQVGTFAVYATLGSLNAPVVTITVSAAPPTGGGGTGGGGTGGGGTGSGNNFVHKVLVEEYSGTWCGNCPRILYGVDLLKQQTNKAIVVGTHLFGNDPFINNYGNSLAASQNVGGVPTGIINRTSGWNGPQYENVNQVIGAIQPFSFAGIAINSTANGGVITANIKVNYSQSIGASAKLTVYVVEDDLYFSQRNYSSNLYGGQAVIPNFRYDGVLRAILTATTGDAIAASGIDNDKTYSITIANNIGNINNARIVAFVTNANGNVVNVQSAKVGEVKAFEPV